MRSINLSLVSVVALMGCCCPLSRDVGRQNDNRGGDDQARPNAGVFQGEKFAFIQQNLRKRRTKDTDIPGSRTDDKFREAPPEGAVLIGFDVGLGDFVDSPIINALRPIYLTKNGEKKGAWIGKAPANPVTTRAKNGYIVGGINIRTGLLIDGMGMKFVRLEDNRLNVNDHYDGQWLGGQGGNPSAIGGAGVLAVGICGHRHRDGSPWSLGLITVPLPQ